MDHIICEDYHPHPHTLTVTIWDTSAGPRAELILYRDADLEEHRVVLPPDKALEVARFLDADRKTDVLKPSWCPDFNWVRKSLGQGA